MKKDKKGSKQRFHYAGVDEEGKATFVECNPQATEDDDVTVVKGRPAEAGKAPPWGSRLAYVHQEGDGEHYTLEDAVEGGDFAKSSGKGPAQVATEAYRSGWQETFGGKVGAN